MNIELDALRARYGRLLVGLFWAHVPVLGLAALWTEGIAPPAVMAMAAVMAAIYHALWIGRGALAPVTRNVAALLLVMEPALFLLVFEGHPWQMDMHMYFYAVLALNLAWFDRGALIVAAGAITAHHLVLFHLLPGAVFSGAAVSGGGGLARVLLHAAVVAFQTAVLVWVSDKVVQSFARIGRMSDEIVAKSAALEERTREAEEANRTKTMFLANMSHEIRTPINAILGFCHLVQRTPLEPRQREHLGRISTAGGVLLRLINDLLDFTKNEAGALVLESRPFDLRAVLSCQIQLMAAEMDARDLTLRQEIDPALPDRLLGDEIRLNQILMNLLSNAAKFTRDGEIVVRARLARRAGRMAEIEISVRDTGIGMSEAQMARIFTPFTQADSSTTRRFGGTGLGLAICRQIVAQMDGWIRAESVMGQGSTFTFMVRIEIARDAPAPDAPEGATRPDPAIRGLRVLIADDSAITLDLLEEIFARWHMPVAVARSGAAVMDRLGAADREGRGFDLLIMDWALPGMGGAQMLRALRRMAPGRPPFCMVMAAQGVDAVMRDAAGAPIDAFLAKPFDAAALLDAIGRLPVPSSCPTGGAGDRGPCLPQGLRGLRVLLVEDNPINQEIALALLHDAGLEVDCAENGLVACQRVEADPGRYAAVLMDMQMPEMDGLCAARRIRRSPGADTLPIIALTAHAYAEERAACLQAGMCDHLSKPVDPAALIAVLARHMRPADPLPPASAPASHARPVPPTPAVHRPSPPAAREVSGALPAPDATVPAMPPASDAATPDASPASPSASVAASARAGSCPSRAARVVPPPSEIAPAGPGAGPGGAGVLAEGGLPATLAPFDIAAGLQRVNGRAALLRRLILSFAEAHRGTADRLAALIREGRAEEAMRLAHTLRGLSASLGLPGIARLASDLEAGLRAAVGDTGGATVPGAEAAKRAAPCPDQPCLPATPGATRVPRDMVDPDRDAARDAPGLPEGLLARMERELARAVSAAETLRGSAPRTAADSLELEPSRSPDRPQGAVQLGSLDALPSNLQPCRDPRPSPEGGDDPAPHPQHLALLRAGLAEQLRRRSMGARAGFDALADALLIEPAARGAHPLHQALMRLDYAAAAALLEAGLPDPDPDPPRTSP